MFSYFMYLQPITRYFHILLHNLAESFGHSTYLQDIATYLYTTPLDLGNCSRTLATSTQNAVTAVLPLTHPLPRLGATFLYAVDSDMRSLWATRTVHPAPSMFCLGLHVSVDAHPLFALSHNRGDQETWRTMGDWLNEKNPGTYAC